MLARFGDTVGEVAAHLGRQRHDSAQDLAEWRDIILCDPFCQTHQLIGEKRDVIQHLLYGLDGGRIREAIIMQPDNDPNQSLPAEGDEYTRADLRLDPIHRVGEGPIQRNRQRNVTKVGHRI
jgi:hypothetical protein